MMNALIAAIGVSLILVSAIFWITWVALIEKINYVFPSIFGEKPGGD